MTLSQYSDFVTNIPLWLEREDLTATLIDDLLRLGELRLQRALKLRFRDIEVNGNFVVGQDYITLPTDCVEPRMLRVNRDPAYSVDIVSLDELIRVRADTDLPAPAVAAPHALTLKLAPTPTATTQYTLFYHAGISGLSVTNTTNWLTQQCPDGLLYAALAESPAYFGMDERLPLWEAKLKEIVLETRRREWRARTGGGPLRVRSDSPVP